MEEVNKLSLPATILIASIILGGFYYMSEKNKQESIEKQQHAEAIQQKVEKDRQFDASQKEACLTIYKQESSKWNNTNGWRYDADEQKCYIQYKESPKKTKAQCDDQYQGSDGKVPTFFFTDWLLCYDGLFEKSF